MCVLACVWTFAYLYAWLPGAVVVQEVVATDQQPLVAAYRKCVSDAFQQQHHAWSKCDTLLSSHSWEERKVVMLEMRLTLHSWFFSFSSLIYPQPVCRHQTNYDFDLSSNKIKHPSKSGWHTHLQPTNLDGRFNNRFNNWPGVGYLRRLCWFAAGHISP